MAEEELTDLEAIVLRYNKVAIDYLRTENYKEAFVLLKKAENILFSDNKKSMPKRLKLISITYKSLSTYYKRHKKPLVALNYIQKSIKLDEEIGDDISNIASSHLNICALLSCIGKHEEALEHAKKATELLEEARMEKPENLRIMSSLVASHYNSAIELEYIGRLADGYSGYLSALEIAERELGKGHPFCFKIENAIAKIKNRFSKYKSAYTQREFSPNRTIVIQKQVRFPTITPTSHKSNGSSLRNAMTPGRMNKDRIGFQDII